MTANWHSLRSKYYRGPDNMANGLINYQNFINLKDVYMPGLLMVEIADHYAIPRISPLQVVAAVHDAAHFLRQKLPSDYSTCFGYCLECMDFQRLLSSRN